jgi:hypothetical protein
MEKYSDSINQGDCNYLEEVTAERESVKIKNSSITRRISFEVEMSI